ncbi:MAG: MoaD/ThiS family protein [Candidatus Aminicenantes bacterium]|nr:MoaD/ThiS family protein [Candidatus Aminicenantes bacterium]NLH77439.1 MoaD/ThiS family protein [Acidobacteriota bacterium]
MTVRVKFFAYFREVFGGRERDLELAPGDTVADALDRLADTPARRRELLDGAALKPHLVVMINGAPVGSLRGAATPLSPGDTLAVFPLVGGG